MSSSELYNIIFPKDKDWMQKPSRIKEEEEAEEEKSEEIPEEEQKNYPIEGQEGKFYKTKYNTDNPKMYNVYGEALADIQNILRAQIDPVLTCNMFTIPIK